MHRLILASASPRRKELLQKAGFRFHVFPVKVSETPNKTLNIEDQILDIAGRKSKAAFLEFSKTPRTWPYVVLSADTEVIFEGQPLGKPKNSADAKRTLTRLSGSVHEVITAVQWIDSETKRMDSYFETTKIIFKNLSVDEIENYVSTGEPMDKAGSYGIQGLGGNFVSKIDGNFENVVGLPIQALSKIFKDKNWGFSE